MKNKILVPVKEGRVKRVDIEYVEGLLASHNEELTTEELSDFKFIDRWKKGSNKKRSQRKHLTQNVEANDVQGKRID